ncbi:MAG: hypothetical protein V1908_03460 [Candidatus Peregrinibacteria bacterium]
MPGKKKSLDDMSCAEILGIDVRRDVLKLLLHFKRRYGLKIEFTIDPDDDLDSLSDLFIYLDLLKEELSKYPPEYVRYCRWRKIIFTGKGEQYWKDLDWFGLMSKVNETYWDVQPDPRSTR